MTQLTPECKSRESLLLEWGWAPCYRYLGTALSGPVRTFVGVRALKKESSKEEGKGEMKLRKSRTRKERRQEKDKRKAQKSRANAEKGTEEGNNEECG